MKKMKMINKIKTVSCSMGLLVALFSLPSCLKNGNYYVDFASAGASVDLPLAASNANGLVAYTYNATITSATIPVYVNLASPAKLGTATSVTVALDTAGLDAYNTNNGTSYALLPDSVYTITGSYDLSIPANQRLDSFQVNLDLTKLDLSGTYVLPYTIASAAVPIEQWNHLLLYISVKNQYDGNYTVTGTFSDVSNATFTANYPMNINLITSGPNSVDVFNTDLGLVGYEFVTPAGNSYYGSFGVRIFIDPVSNKVTSVINKYGQPAANTRSAVLDPSGINAWDPTTGNIDVKYFMTQPSVIPAPPSIRSYFNEHYQYNGPR
jgi:Domain of unknown function (DUF1735)